MADTAKIISEMELAKQEYIYAQDSTMGIRRARERMLNLAWNYYDDLLAALKENADLQEQLDSMEAALLASAKPATTETPQAKAKKPAAERKGGE